MNITTSMHCPRGALGRAAAGRSLATVHRAPVTRLLNRRSRRVVVPVRSFQGGGSDGGTGGSSRFGTGGPGDGSSPGGAQHQQLLAAVAAAVVLLLSDAPQCSASPEVEEASNIDRSDLGRLKRLLREAFADLVGVKERLAKLEAGSESEDEAPPEPRGDVSIRAGAWSRGRRRVARPRSKVQLHGMLEAGLHLPWATQQAGSGRSEATRDLRAAGLSSGPTTFLTLHKVFKEAGQALYARAALRQGSSINITEATYKAELLPALRVMLSLQGGSLERLAPALNPFAENAGLSRVVRKGHALRSASEQGTGGAVSLLSPPFTLTAASLTQAADDGSTTHVSSVQTGVSFKDSGALHVVASSTRPGQPPVGSTPRASDHSAATSTTGSLRYHGMLAPAVTASVSGLGVLTELGIAGAAKLASGVAVSGWAAHHIAGGSMTTPWGASLHALPDSSGHSATVAVAVLPPSGSSKPQRVMWELSTKLAAGDGLLLVPGMVMVQSGSSRSMSISLNTAWHF